MDTELRLVNVFGIPGSGALIGRTPELSLPWAIQATPWSHTTILIADSGNHRVVEVDVAGHALVKVGPMHEIGNESDGSSELV